MPRGVYGSYLEDTLSAARKAAAPGVDCETRAIEVVGVRRFRDRYALSFRGAAPAAYDHVAFCIGNLPPALPCQAGGDLGFPRYISYRELEEMMGERGVAVDHTTVYRWTQRYAPELEKRGTSSIGKRRDSQLVACLSSAAQRMVTKLQRSYGLLPHGRQYGDSSTRKVY